MRPAYDHVCLHPSTGQGCWWGDWADHNLAANAACLQQVHVPAAPAASASEEALQQCMLLVQGVQVQVGWWLVRLTAVVQGLGADVKWSRVLSHANTCVGATWTAASPLLGSVVRCSLCSCRSTSRGCLGWNAGILTVEGKLKSCCAASTAPHCFYSFSSQPVSASSWLA